MLDQIYTRKKVTNCGRKTQQKISGKDIHKAIYQY